MDKTSWVIAIITGKFDDRDRNDSPEQLTVFPPPGDSKRRDITQLLPNVEECLRDAKLPKPATNSRQAVEEVLNAPYSREYWMPDKLCKVCYECELPFNMFRRKHHCRFCGQVFCHSCSSHFVDGRSLLLVGMVRACKLCYSEVSKNTQTPLVPATTEPSERTDGEETFRVLLPSGSTGILTNYPSQPSHKVTTAVNCASSSSTSSSTHRRGLFGCEACLERRKGYQGPLNIAALEWSTHNPCRPIKHHEQGLCLAKFLSSVVSVKPETPVDSPHLRGEAQQDVLCAVSSQKRQRLSGDEFSHTQHTCVETSVTAPIQLTREPSDQFWSSNNRACVEAMFSEHTELPNDKTGNSSSSLLLTQHLKVMAADHLEHMVKKIVRDDWSLKRELCESWSSLVLDLAQQVCSWINPNVQTNEDGMDIRPYVKIKLIPGGSVFESRCVDGIVFRKQVVHKMMRKSAFCPRVLIIAGGIEFQRAHSKLASFCTLMEQERKYMQIIVDKVVRLRPQLLLVGHSISRHAQECLRQHDVTAIQHVKPKLMQRIARMTGATVLSSVDHVTSMGQHAHKALGLCRRFQVVTYPETGFKGGVCQGGIRHLQVGQVASETGCATRNSRQRLRGRGYTSYVYLTGCPKELGCSIVLRGINTPILKKLKQIVRYVTFATYHLRLECAYLEESHALLTSIEGADTGQCSRQPAVEPVPLSSSLLVAFGNPRRHERMCLSNCRSNLAFRVVPEMSSIAHQLLLVTTVWMSHKTQFVPAEVRGLMYYSQQDTCLGQYLMDYCFNLDAKHLYDKRSAVDLIQLFHHDDGCLRVTVLKLDHLVPATTGSDYIHMDPMKERVPCDGAIHMWSFCKLCRRNTPMVKISADTWKLSFGKFLEFFFYNKHARCGLHDCHHVFQTQHVKYFGLGNLIARFEHEEMHPYSICMRHRLPFDYGFYLQELKCQYRELRSLSQTLFNAFNLKLDELHAAFEEADAAVRKLGDYEGIKVNTNGAVMVDSHVTMLDMALEALQAELGQIAREVKHHELRMGLLLSEEIERRLIPSKKNPGLGVVYFPSQYRHELYMRATNWNRRFSLLGQLSNTLRDSCQVCLDGLPDGLVYNAGTSATVGNNITVIIEELQHLQHCMIETSVSSSAFEVIVGGGTGCDDERDEFHEDADKFGEKDLIQTSQANMRSSGHVERHRPVKKPGQSSAVGCVESTPNEHPLAASPIRNCHESLNDSEFVQQHRADQPSYEVVSHTLDGSGKHQSEMPSCTGSATGWRDRFGASDRPACAIPRKSYKISSALARLLGKDSPEEDPWTVHLGEWEGSRPRLDALNHGEVMQVHEEQPTTVIAYSLNTLYYKRSVHAQNGKILNLAISQPTKSGPWRHSSAKENEDSGHLSLRHRFLSTTGCNLDVHKVRSALSKCAWVRAAVSFARMKQEPSLQVGDEALLTFQPNPISMIPSVNGVKYCARVGVLNENDLKTSTLSYAGLHNDSHEAVRQPPVNCSMIDDFRSTYTSMFRKIGIHCMRRASVDCVERDSTALEKLMLSQIKTHVKHRFADVDDLGNTLCKFVCHAYWATQFAAVRQAYFGEGLDEELGFLRSLSMARPWNAQGGKSGATFLKTTDGRFVVKQITRTELQMFLEYAPAYFEYLSKAFFHDYPTILVKVLGVYQIGSHNRVSGKKIMEQVVVMQNLFHECVMTRVFDLKGSTRSRYARVSSEKAVCAPSIPSLFGHSSRLSSAEAQPVLLDDNFVEFTSGRPLPLYDQAKLHFDYAVLNDTLFLSVINVVDYSILVGIDDANGQLVVGIIDYMRQYDIIKKVERMGKSVGMIAGQAEPTVIQPPNYRNRFQAAMAKYFMMVPDKWTTFRLHHADRNRTSTIGLHTVSQY